MAGTVGGSNNQFNWALVGNRGRFGHGINDGRHFRVGDFNGDGKLDVLFFFRGDGNWWRGTVDANNHLNWSLWYKTSVIYFVYPNYVGSF